MHKKCLHREIAYFEVVVGWFIYLFSFSFLPLYLRTSRISPKPPHFGVGKEGMTFFSEGQGKGRKGGGGRIK